MVNDMQKINFTDKAIHFTRHNLKIFVSIFVSILILFLSFFFFKNLQEKNSIKIADQYTQASILVKQKKILESKLLLESIISENHQFQMHSQSTRYY